jgi:hypothetical protein
VTFTLFLSPPNPEVDLTAYLSPYYFLGKVGFELKVELAFFSSDFDGCSFSTLLSF